jgi:hypothetical protein
MGTGDQQFNSPIIYVLSASHPREYLCKTHESGHLYRRIDKCIRIEKGVMKYIKVQDRDDFMTEYTETVGELVNIVSGNLKLKSEAECRLFTQTFRTTILKEPEMTNRYTQLFDQIEYLLQKSCYNDPYPYNHVSIDKKEIKETQSMLTDIYNIGVKYNKMLG